MLRKLKNSEDQKILEILETTEFTQISRELPSSLYSSIWIAEKLPGFLFTELHRKNTDEWNREERTHQLEEKHTRNYK